MKVLSVLFLMVFSLRAEISTVVINSNHLPGTVQGDYKGTPTVSLIIYNDKKGVDFYDVSLPWTDQNGISFIATQTCWVINKQNDDTLCSFSINASYTGTPEVTEHSFKELIDKQVLK